MTAPILSLSVEIDPIGKQRARVTKNGTFTPKATVIFEQTIRNAAEVERERIGLDQLDGVELGLWITIYFGAGRRADIDNVVKGCQDGLQQKHYRKQGYLSPGLYKSDNRVRSVIAVEAAHHVDTPHIHIAVYHHTDMKLMIERMQRS